MRILSDSTYYNNKVQSIWEVLDDWKVAEVRYLRS